MALTALEKGEINAAFVGALLQCAAEDGLSQKDLAIAAGIDPGSVTKLKNGAKALTVVEFWRMSAVLSQGRSELVRRVESTLRKG